MEIKKEILDELIKDYKNPEDLLGENGLLKQLTKALLERAMQAELTHELGFAKDDRQAIKETTAGMALPRKPSNPNTARLNWRFREIGSQSLSQSSSKSINGGSMDLTI